MNLVDAGVLLLLAVGLFSGARAGFLGPVLGLVGAGIGFGLALILAGVFRDQLALIEQPLRGIVTLLALGAFVISGEATGAAIGATMSLGLRNAGLRPLDALGGAVVGVAHVVLLVWLVAGVLAAGMAPGRIQSMGRPSRAAIGATIRAVAMDWTLTTKHSFTRARNLFGSTARSTRRSSTGCGLRWA